MPLRDLDELFDPREILPAELHDFLTITEIDRAEFLVDPLFQRKFGEGPPERPRHLVALYRDCDAALHLAGYSHMWPYGEVYLSGGSCTEGTTIRHMAAHERTALEASGGVWHHLLKYAFRKYANCCEAFFGHCGDPRALEVALASGFVRTGIEPLIVNWHKPLSGSRRDELLHKVHALGDF